MSDYKYVIVGAGLSGLTIAERIANELDEEVLIIEKRDHIGGNVYDFYKDGLLIQKYGPHIYHTKEKKVHDYLSQFTEWTDYVHRVLSCVDGKLVPMPICIDTLNQLYDLDLDENSMREWIDEHKEDIDEVKSSEDVVLKNAGRDIYNKLFKNYTEKQWGTSAANLSPSVISRIPFRFNHDTRYFDDPYQGMPKEGFTKMCENMIKSDKIHVGLKADYKDYIHRINYEKLIYTGPIDYFYNIPDLFVSHYGTDGQTQLLVVDLLGDGQTQRIPLLIALLFVGRNGVVNYSLYTVFGQILLQFVTLSAAHREQMECMCFPICHLRQHNFRISNLCTVTFSHLLAQRNILI